MDVTYIREVLLDDDYYDEAASHAVLTISPKLYKQIKTAQSFIKKFKGYCVSTFDYTPEFMDNKDDVDDPTLDNLTENDTMILDCLELKITQDGIFWSGSVKHTSIEAYTDRVDIEEIDHNFLVLKAPLKELPLLVNHCEYESSKDIAKERLKKGA